MKKKSFIILAIIIMFNSTYILGATPKINIELKVVEKGNSEKEILVIGNNLKNIYTSSIELKECDGIIGIEVGSLLDKHYENILELEGENEKKFAFTFMGDKKGVSGSGEIFKIKVKGNINLTDISEKNIDLKLVERTNDNMELVKFNFANTNNTSSNNQEQINDKSEESFSEENSEKKNSEEKAGDENSNISILNDNHSNDNNIISNNIENSIIEEGKELSEQSKEVISKNTSKKNINGVENKIKYGSLVVGIVIIFILITIFIYKKKE